MGLPKSQIENENQNGGQEYVMHIYAHNKILEIAADIESCLEILNSNKYIEVLSKVRKFLGYVKHHLAVEDRSLYPKLLDSPDKHQRLIVSKLSEKVGSCYQESVSYEQSYANLRAIEKETARFITETHRLIAIVTDRIEQENELLFS